MGVSSLRDAARCQVLGEQDVGPAAAPAADAVAAAVGFYRFFLALLQEAPLGGHHGALMLIAKAEQMQERIESCNSGAK